MNGTEGLTANPSIERTHNGEPLSSAPTWPVAPLALDRGFVPVVSPKVTRLSPWEYDRDMYKRRNEVERLFRRLKGYRRIFSRFEKLDVMFVGFISFALIVGDCVCVNGP